MLLAATLALALQQNEILVCKHDAKGKVIVTRDQWVYVHQVLASKDSSRVLNIIHPKHNLVVRMVSTSFPEPNGAIKVYRMTWSRSTVIERLRYSGGYDANSPGNEYEMVMQLDPDAKVFEGPVVMKGLMLYEITTLSKDFRLIQNPSKKASERFRRDYRRLSPITYVRLAPFDGHLWLAEISSYVPAE